MLCKILELSESVFCIVNGFINAVKYRAELVDGTIVAESPEGGVEFYVKDGDFVSIDNNCIAFIYFKWENLIFYHRRLFCVVI